MSSWATIRYYQGALEANYARCLLEAEGIMVHLKDEHSISTNPMAAQFLGGIKLQVPSEDQERALELIELREKEIFEEDKEDPTPVCAHCGSHDLEGPYTTLRTFNGWLGFVVGASMFGYPMNYDRVRVCRVCKKRTGMR